MAGSPTSRNLIAVIIGAVLLFGAISVLPMYVCFQIIPYLTLMVPSASLPPFLPPF
jgi:hypothetical protein